MKLMTIPEILEVLPSIEKQISSISESNKKKILLGKFKELKGHVKSKKDNNYSIHEILSYRLYNEIELLLRVDDINYNIESVFAPSGDQIKIFLKHSKNMDDATYWSTLKSVYIHQDYTQIDHSIFKKLFSSNKSSKEKLMSEEELLYFSQLPEEFNIYRGCSASEQESNFFGISWTLNKEIAQQFAEKKAILNKKKMVVVSKTIKRNQAIAYFNERLEEEIIYIQE